jgi:uncharacterized protein (DUF2147 family)
MISQDAVEARKGLNLLYDVTKQVSANLETHNQFAQAYSAVSKVLEAAQKIQAPPPQNVKKPKGITKKPEIVTIKQDTKEGEGQ